MVAVALLLVLGTGLLALDMHVRHWAVRTSAEIASRVAADAGLTEAVYQMNEKLKAGPWDDETLPGASDATLPNCDATYTFHIVGDANSDYTVESFGNSGRFTRRVNANLRLRGVFDNAIYATTSILLENNILIDAPNSGVATDPTGTGTTLENSAEVEGEIREESWDLPLLPPPAGGVFAVSKGKIETDTILTPADSGRYDQIKLKGETLTIRPDDNLNNGSPPVILYVTGEVSLDTNGRIQVENDGSLLIYAGGDLTVRNSSNVNYDTQQARKVMVVACAAAPNVTIENSTDFCGVIYAPTARVIVENNVRYRGAVVSRTSRVKNHVTLTYDESLAGGNFLNLPVKFVVDRWWQGEEW